MKNKVKDPNMKLSYCVTEDDYMKKRIKAYLAFIDKILAGELPVTASFDIEGKHGTFAKKDVAPTRKEYELLLIRHLEQIAFFSHERLVHLIVFCLVAVCTVMCILTFVVKSEIMILPLIILLFVLLVPYCMHYYLLENSVQKMYEQYDKMIGKTEKYYTNE